MCGSKFYTVQTLDQHKQEAIVSQVALQDVINNSHRNHGLQATATSASYFKIVKWSLSVPTITTI